MKKQTNIKFFTKALIKSEDDTKISDIIQCYNEYIKKNSRRVNIFDRRRLEHLLLKTYGIKSIKDEYLTYAICKCNR
jgi:hypothetical protein